MNSSTHALLIALVALITLPSAQSAISRYTIDGGGGVSEGGDKRITGTIGQPDAGVLEGGASRIRGGFWPGAVLSGPATATPTPTPTATGTVTPTPSVTLTLTTTPIGIYFDVKPDPLDGFIDARDLTEWVDRMKGSNGDLDVLFEFSLHWRNDYPPSRKGRAGTE